MKKNKKEAAMRRLLKSTVVLLAVAALASSCTQPTEKDTIARGPGPPVAKRKQTAQPEKPQEPPAEPEKPKDVIVDHPSKLKFPELEFEPPKAADYRVKLDSGMILYIAEDKELPTFDMQVIVQTGSMYEPAEKIGLAAMCGALLRKGGTTSMKGEEIDEVLAQLAGSLSARIGFSSGSVSLSVLKEDTDEGLKVLADVLMNPVFDDDEIRRYREKALQNLEHRYDRPGTLLSDMYSSLLYESHPAGRIPSASSVKAITSNDLLNFHEKYFHPNNCIVAVAGDFDRDEMIKKIEKLFANWDAADIEFPEVPDIQKKFESGERGVFLLEKDINQGYVRLGHLGIREDNPDVYAVRLMNTILGGGGFISRITSRVRSDEGLAYSVGSWFDIPVDYTGTFTCSFQTKAKSVAYATSIVMEEINRIRTELVSEEDLQRAKDLFIERFPSIFSGRGSAAYARVQALARNEYKRRPLDYYENYRDNYGKVTREQVLEAAKKYLNPDSLKIVVVGKTQEIKAGDEAHEAKLEDFGEIKKLEPPDVMK
jgi:predicted Zn-dependent peptidase